MASTAQEEEVLTKIRRRGDILATRKLKNASASTPAGTTPPLLSCVATAQPYTEQTTVPYYFIPPFHAFHTRNYNCINKGHRKTRHTNASRGAYIRSYHTTRNIIHHMYRISPLHMLIFRWTQQHTLLYEPIRIYTTTTHQNSGDFSRNHPNPRTWEHGMERNPKSQCTTKRLILMRTHMYLHD